MMATRQDGRVLAPILLALSGLAWLTLVLGGQSPYGRYLDHQQIDGSGGAAELPVFVLGWLLMMVAMMLPTSLPLVRLFDTMTRRRVDHRRLVLLLLAGYLGIWSVFGIVVHALDGLLHALVRQSGWLTEHAWLIGPAVLVLAGIYQFTPLKYTAWTSAARRWALSPNAGGVGMSTRQPCDWASITARSASVAAGR
jgi:predicted metal-binding membrane protein